MEEKQKYPILFVGAGPGDPELITVKGMKALQKADLIIYAGSLVPEKVLTWTRPEAEKINSAGMDLEEIISKIVSAYRRQQKIVRLHTGDPTLFGAIQEQTAELEREGIPFRIIPGVTAAFAAAAAKPSFLRAWPAGHRFPKKNHWKNCHFIRLLWPSISVFQELKIYVRFWENPMGKQLPWW